jgi:predicted peptidase
MRLAFLLFLGALAPSLLGAQTLESRMTARKFKGDAGQLPYRIFVPPGIGEEVPLVLFLHGAGERGDDNGAQLKHGVADILGWCEKTGNPAVLLVPQCPKEGFWAPLNRETKDLLVDVDPSAPQQLVMELLETVVETVKVDRDRIYVTGLSMGGYGTWDLLWRHPGRFAAAIPICGGGRTDKAREIKYLPIWVVHGAMDKAIPVSQSRRMVKSLKSAGARSVKYSEYPKAGHDSWSATYANPEVLAWLFAQKR